MAPIFAAIGIAPQIIDDDRLRSLRSSLESVVFNGPIHNKDSISDTLNMPLDIERLVELLEPWQSWTFEEQVSFTNLFVMKLSCSLFYDMRSRVSNKIIYILSG